MRGTTDLTRTGHAVVLGGGIGGLFAAGCSAGGTNG